MKLAGVLIRRKALKDHIEQLKFRLTKMAKAQGRDMPTERPQELLVALEVRLQDLRVLTTPSNPANTRATLRDGTTPMQVIAQGDHPHLGLGILEALATSTLPAQDRYTYTANARPDGWHSETTYRGGQAVHYLLRVGRHHLEEGGLRHVPAIASSAHSQAPPIPQVGHAGDRRQHT
jgi:hypothetical protein